MKTFKVTEAHIKLIKNMRFDYDEYTEFGAPRVDPKRPYGNGDVLRDMWKILGIKKDGYSSEYEFTEIEEQTLMYLHKECTDALSILVQFLKLETGIYKRDIYQKWHKE